MADPVTVPADGTDGSGAPADKGNEHVDKILKEKKNAMEALRAEQARVKELEAKLKAKDEQDMVKNQQFEALAKAKETEANDWKAKFETSQKTIQDSQKIASIKREMAKLGLQSKHMENAMRFVDLSTVQMDSATSVVLGAEEAAKAVLSTVPEFFGDSANRVDHSAPGGTPTAVTMEKWKAMSPADQKKYEPDLYKTLGIARKH